jgi:hypothetical protein
LTNPTSEIFPLLPTSTTVNPFPNLPDGKSGAPILLNILGGNEFRLRQGFAAQNAWTRFARTAWIY